MDSLACMCVYMSKFKLSHRKNHCTGPNQEFLYYYTYILIILSLLGMIQFSSNVSVHGCRDASGRVFRLARFEKESTASRLSSYQRTRVTHAPHCVFSEHAALPCETQTHTPQWLGLVCSITTKRGFAISFPTYKLQLWIYNKYQLNKDCCCCC